MNDSADDLSSSEEEKKAVSVSPWLRATMADLQDLDFESPIADSNSADASALAELFHKAIKSADSTTEPSDSAGTRVAILLSSVAGMHFNPAESNEPFGPMAAFADGRRSAIPSDFRVGHIDLLAELASRARHPVLRTRLADVCWLLDRKRANLGMMALAGYCEIVAKVDAGELLFRYAEKDSVLYHEAQNYLRRALQIARSLGWEKPESAAARNIVVQLRERATELRALVPLLWFAEIDLDFRVSEPLEVGTAIEVVLANLPPDAHSHVVIEGWRLAARAYRAAKREEDRFRCQAAAAEQLVADADAAAKRQDSAMLAAHWLSAAIAQLHGIPGKKERRTELRHRLIDVQARIPEEMSSFSHEIDLREIIEYAEKLVRKPTLIDKLFAFASLGGSPAPADLVRNAQVSIREHPLSSLFETSHMDHEGKVIHRTEGVSGNSDGAAIASQIARAESIRRQLMAAGKIEPARQIVMSEHFLSDDVLRLLLQHSPFVPEDLVDTFARGFSRFFQGDFVSAVYVLTPLLENSLRYVLKMSGHDVSIFDDATQTQEDRTISSLFEQMRAELDHVLTSAITTDIENVFLTKLGPSLRHSVAHGLLRDGSPYGTDAIYACWLIFRLCLLPLFPHHKQLQQLLGA